MNGRQHRVHWSQEAYNKVTRLEGQINTAMEILRFRDRYAVAENATQEMLLLSREKYFNMIDSLQEEIFERGMDLTAAKNVASLVHMIDTKYLGDRSLVSAEEVERPGQWAQIIFLQQLQIILEDENLTIEKSLIDGWLLTMNPEGYPAAFYPKAKEIALLWKSTKPAEKEEFFGGIPYPCYGASRMFQ